MQPDFTLEQQHDALVCGIDEVGRGPLAGPVVAACVIVPEEVRAMDFWQKVKDSKKLGKKLKNELFEHIRAHSFFGIAEASPAEIDELNIHHATLLAMRRAYDSMRVNYQCEAAKALIDGKFVPELPCPGRAVIKGDGISTSIAAASILAKVTRDRMMADLHCDFPVYGWERNVGYGTKEHLQAINDNGITAHHRRSFSPCSSY